ncbi:hypothetical protein [Streptomyces coelicoflavus]|uniref:hypothetical protein n=1 Tax=Streptomyces coelicoflavus TaxID=285562 RepID=UPI003F4A26C5
MTLTATRRYDGGQLELRFVDGSLYVHGEAVDTEFLKGASWFSADRAVWGGASYDNNSHGLLPRQLEGSPIVQSAMLTASKDVRRIGTDTIEDVPTTHYRGTVTTDGIRAARDAATDEAARERQIGSLDQFYAMRLEDTLTMDLWVGDDNRTKRFRMRSETHAVKGGTVDQQLEIIDGEPLDMTVTFLDVNEPVTVDAPPADDTADLGELADELGTA